MTEEDIGIVYESERSRGSRHPKTPGAIATERLQRQIVKLIMNPGTDQRGLEAILRDFGLRDGSPDFLRYVKLWQEWKSGKP